MTNDIVVKFGQSAVRFLINLASLQLGSAPRVASCCDESESHPMNVSHDTCKFANYLKFSNPFNIIFLRKDEKLLEGMEEKRTWLSRFHENAKSAIYIVGFFMGIYCNLKWTLIAVLHFLHDYFLDTVRLTNFVTTNVTIFSQNQQISFNRTIRCAQNTEKSMSGYNAGGDVAAAIAQKQAADQQDERLLFVSRMLTNWLIYLGDIFVSSNGAPTIVYMMLLVGPILYLFMSVIHGTRLMNLRADVLNFVLEPQMERERLNIEFNILRSNLIESLTTFMFNIDEFRINEKKWLHHNEQIAMKSDDNMLKYANGIEGEVDHSNAPNRIEPKDYKLHLVNEKVLSYIRILNGIDSVEIVLPRKLSHWWHRFLCKLFAILIIVSPILCLLGATATVLAFTYVELNERVLDRLESIDCKNYMNSNHSFKNLDNHLQRAQLSDEDLSVFIRHNERVIKSIGYVQSNYGIYYEGWYNYYPLLLIESRHFFSNSTNLRSIWEFLILIGFFSLWFCFYLALHLCSHLDRIVWLDEIDEQIERCIRLMDVTSRSSLDQNNLIKSRTSLKREDNELFRTVTITYLSFELFRRDQKQHQALANFLVLQNAIYCLTVVALVYLISITIKTDAPFVVLVTAFNMVIMLNLYLLTSAVLTSKMDKLIQAILRLLANSRLYCINMSFMFNLWQRQLTIPLEFRRLLAPSLLGNYLSWTKVLQIDASALAVYLIILQTKK